VASGQSTSNGGCGGWLPDAQPRTSACMARLQPRAVGFPHPSGWGALTSNGKG
jgi:hypothetical protein